MHLPASAAPLLGSLLLGLGSLGCGVDPTRIDAAAPLAAREGTAVDPLLLGAPMHEARAEHAATLLTDGRVLVTGGVSDGGGLTSAELFDPATASWTETGPMTSGHELHTATRLTDGRVLVVGGPFPGNASGVDLFSPATGQWSAGPPMPLARVEHTATLLADGRVLVAGGNNDGPLFTALLYVPSKKVWADAGSLHLPRRGHTSTLLPDGRVLVTGGILPSDAANLNPPELGVAELYDLQKNGWVFASPGLSFRRGHTATLLADGRVLITGGRDEATDAGDLLATAELYDPIAGTWTSIATMSAPHAGHTATALPSGHVLIAGGDPARRITELFDPETGAWTLGGLLARGRTGHTATLLPSGHVLLTGGFGDGGDLIASAELVHEGVLGEPCQSPWECATGYCADGVCCDTPCGGDVPGACRVCSAALGAVTDGTCTTVTTCGATSVVPPPEVSFGVQVCNADTPCPEGTFCVDGVCCDSPCTDPCSSCILSTSPGHCAPQPEGFDLRHHCGPLGNCDSTCGPEGTCVLAGTGTQCRPSMCDPDGIHGTGAASCPAQGAACPTDLLAFTCAPYRCVAAFGLCSAACLTVDDCAPPYVCDPLHHCVSPPDTASGSECAAMPGARAGLGAWASLLLLGVARLIRRRRDKQSGCAP
ncbi:MAG: kelch repeat-containing protein [Byssovorax sp.]